MVEIAEVIKFLRPEGGFIVRGNTFDGIEFLECEPFTEEEFDQAKTDYKAWKEQKELDMAAKKEAAINKLAALGLTVEDLKLLNIE